MVAAWTALMPDSVGTRTRAVVAGTWAAMAQLVAVRTDVIAELVAVAVRQTFM